MKKLLKSCMNFSKPEDELDSNPPPESEALSGLQPESEHGSKPNMMSLSDVRMATKEWHDDCYLGGRSCSVYKSTLDHREIVAFKRLLKHPSMRERYFKRFKAEKDFLQYLCHENIIQLKGICTEKDELILVLEYVPNGTLYSRLRGTKGKLLGWEARMKIALGAARAINYIHHHAVPGPVVHRDIKTTHILTDESDNAKLIDFSNAILEPMNMHCSHLVGTEPYTAPEYKRDNRLSRHCDIHGFGVVLLELITGRGPMQDGKPITEWASKKLELKAEWDRVVPEMVDKKIRRFVPPQDLLKMMKLATDCISGDFRERPGAGQVVSRLLDISCLTRIAPASSGVGRSSLDPIIEE